MLVLAYPLIAAVAIHDGPNIGDWQRFHQLQIGPKCFQPDATPNIATGLRMPVRPKEFVKDILMQRKRCQLIALLLMHRLLQATIG